MRVTLNDLNNPQQVGTLWGRGDVSCDVGTGIETSR